MRYYGLLVLLVLLTACQALPALRSDPAYFVIRPGAKLVLNQDLTIPAGRVSVYVQGGQLVPYAELNGYHPHCKFELRAIKDAPQTVTADTFLIERVRRDVVHSVGIEGAQRVSTVNHDGGPTFVVYATMLDLRAPAQPNVMRLTCGQWDDPYRATHLTVDEMRRALGGIFTLALAAVTG